MSIAKVQFANQDLEVISIRDNDGQLWLLANPFARILEYSNSRNAISKFVRIINQVQLQDIVAPRYEAHTSSLHPQSKFINRAGLFELIQASRMPKAQEFRDWINSDLLPKLCDEGKYDMVANAPCEIASGMNAVHAIMHDGAHASWSNPGPSTSNAAAEYDKRIAEAKMDAMRARLELTESKLEVSELRLAHEREASAWKEREYEMRLQMKDMAMQANMSLEQFALNYQLADRNVEQNARYRNALRSIENRVVPDMADKPHKKEWLVGYLFTDRESGERRLMVMRGQDSRRKLIDASIQGYEKLRREVGGRRKRNRCSGNSSLAWTDGAVKAFEFQCPNPVLAWLRVRTENPEVFYGTEFTNNLKTELRILTIEQLSKKYDTDNTNMIGDCEEFKSLAFVDFADCERRCLYSDTDTAVGLIKSKLEEWLARQKASLCTNEREHTRDNFGDWLTAEQVVHTMHNCTNYFVRNVFNIQMYDTTPPRRPEICDASSSTVVSNKNI
ncbi:Bro10 [Heliothis virescens ascovirus 3g]|uniref:Bro10 n=1 Tax=Heliothis virescens ascovirus 3g TaxID=1246651 RepID=K4NY64_9VIRU|nr:Bro10 [Heliothis virescens ascovirus 3g]AFV50350.1 Bro10 [Heliothis virescens ascovirus 3g]